ncbi:MAG: TatD family nuclease-associated radical SAM protein [Bacillota bacterium]
MQPTTIVYRIGDSLYINLTNRCTNDCEFCIRRTSDGVADHHLWLEQEPTVGQVIQEIEKAPTKHLKEVVFCGFGEPMMRLEEVKAVAKWLKGRGIYVRMNTNGHGNLIHGRNVVPELAGLIDCMSISLNASNAATYDALCHPIYGRQAFKAVLEFARECKKHIPKVVLSIVKVPGVSVWGCRRIAAKLKSEFRVRHYDSHI